MRQVLGMSGFSGGMTVSDEKQGVRNSFLDAQSIDFRKRPSQLSVLPQTSNIGKNLGDLVTAMEQVSDGSRYALGNNGYVYKVSTSNVVTNVGNIKDAGGSGMIYRQDIDRVILTGTKSASSLYPISNNPKLEPSKYGVSKSTDPAAGRDGGMLTYTLSTSIDESEINLCKFTPDIEPLYSLKIFIKTAGTGDVTVTVHDDANNSLGTSTIVAANIQAGEFNEFVFSTPVRMLVKPGARILHFHVTSTVADTVILTKVASDMSQANFEMWADRFVQPNNGLHPAIQFQQYNCFGNERYLSVWEPLADDPSNLEWNRHRLTFPAGNEVCGLALYDEFVAIATEKRSTSSTREFQEGKIFFWDGGSTTYNYFIDVPEGAPYGLFSYKNVLYWFAGGAWWGYAGGKPTKIKTFPNTDSEYSNTSDYTVIYPNMSTVRRGILLMGYPSETSNQSIKHGVYSWGAVEKNYPDTFGYSYPISTGTTTNNGSNNLRIGMVKNFGDTLYVGWRDDSNTDAATKYGLDAVNNSSTPFETAYIESLIFDNGVAWKEKKAVAVLATFKEVPSGATLYLKYKVNRESSWKISEGITSGKKAKFNINKRFYELQFGMNIAISGTTTPEVTFLGLEFDDLRNEGSV